ncbi:MAG: DUF3332 domain-containing protein [candidate division NC10 bacterium]|nr:DUF3332 domain-containing protein [candidate division NC10 bacterium]
MHRRSMTRWLAVALLVAFLPLAASCYGRFQLVRTVYEANSRVEDKFIRSAVTWLLVILPVYGLAGLADFLILNVIEFWQGKNPMLAEDDPVIRTARVGADRIVQTLRHRDGATEMTVERFRDGVLLDRVTLRQPDGSDRLAGSLHVPGAPTVTLLAERDGERLLLTRAVAGQAPERLVSSASEVRTLEARVLAALGPVAPTAVARASHP